MQRQRLGVKQSFKEFFFLEIKLPNCIRCDHLIQLLLVLHKQQVLCLVSHRSAGCSSIFRRESISRICSGRSHSYSCRRCHSHPATVSLNSSSCVEALCAEAFGRPASASGNTRAKSLKGPSAYQNSGFQVRHMKYKFDKYKKKH